MYTDVRRKTLRQRVQIHPDGSREYWRDIPDYKGCYRVSDRGQVKSLSRLKRTKGGGIQRVLGKALKPGRHGFGHLHVRLYKNKLGKNRSIHRLVLLAFVGPCPEGMECRHLNGIPDDNRLENLCWGTPKENAADRSRHGKWKFVPPPILRGERNPCHGRNPDPPGCR